MKNAWMVGIDEVGRGPLAGPVTLAYVACPWRIYRRNFKGIKDSKKLTLKKREEWFRHLKAHPHLEYGVTSVGAGTIDDKGISRSVKIAIIAAASVMAKVTRDRKMIRLSKVYPEYQFHVHKGYGTKLHCKLVKKYGLCDIHRRSFCSRLV